jgi:ergothioneine biosynthesis protein EgtB
VSSDPAFDPSLDHLFAFGIDPVDGGLPTDAPADWPALSVVRQYSHRVRSKLDAALGALEFAEWDSDQPPVTLLNVAVEHRLMHAETLAYMLHQMPLNRKYPQTQAVAPITAPPDSGMIEIPAGAATLGLRRGDRSEFGWDNEYELHAVGVPAFAIDRHKVTHRHYLAFIDAGGYRNRELWTEAAWNWINSQGIAHPGFWIPNASGWRYRTMFHEIELPLDWPVYVSHAEAAAYARWAEKRLPTEAEWHRAAYASPSGAERAFPWGDESPSARHGYFDLERWDPHAVNAFPDARSAWGVEGLMANGWEWTSTLFEPFPGFQPFPFYLGYSANFFDGQHYVMKGGSPRTEQCMLRRSFRNWFQPHYPYVYAGFRCAN